MLVATPLPLRPPPVRNGFVTESRDRTNDDDDVLWCAFSHAGSAEAKKLSEMLYVCAFVVN